MAQKNNPFAREPKVALRKVFLLERRASDGSVEHNNIWCEGRYKRVEDKIARLVGHNLEEIHISIDLTAARYSNNPSYLGEVIVKIADSETERIDLDDDGFPRMSLYSSLIPENINIRDLGGEAKNFLRALIAT